MTIARATGCSFAIFISWAQTAATAAELEIGPVHGRVDLTSTTNGGWHSDAGGYGELFERLNVSTGTGAWNLALRLDTATFFSTPPPIESRYTLEKASLGWTSRSLEIIGGDSYVSFGRGLALSLRKVDELGVDTTMRGAKVLVHAGDFAGTLAFGYANINNVDEASGKSVDDPFDLLGGAQAQVTLWDRITVGAHGSVAAFKDGLGLVPTADYTDKYYQFGPTIDAPQLTENFDLYLEGIAQIRDTQPAAEETLRLGAYGAATLYVGAATLLLEGKAYGELEPIQPNLRVPEFASVAYNNPPTVERVLQVIENPQKEIAGGRARFDWSFSPELQVFVSYGVFRDWLGYADPFAPGVTRAGTIHDPYAGLELRWDDSRSWAIASAGWRGVLLSDTVVRGDMHIEADLSQALGDRSSMNLHLLHDQRRKFESQILEVDYSEGTVLLGMRMLPYGSLSGSLDYTTELTQPKHVYFGGTVQWDITPSSSVRAFGGSARGGLRCVSGVCRTFPPFEGVKVTVTLRL